MHIAALAISLPADISEIAGGCRLLYDIVERRTRYSGD